MKNLTLSCLVLALISISSKPKEEFYLGKTGIFTCSFYHKKFLGRMTANGEIMKASDLTAAHKTMSFGTMIEVENLTTGKWLIVRVNDRGPYIQGRQLDLSPLAARKLGMTGVHKMKYTIVGDNGRVVLGRMEMPNSTTDIIKDLSEEDIEVEMPKQVKRKKAGYTKKQVKKKPVKRRAKKAVNVAPAEQPKEI